MLRATCPYRVRFQPFSMAVQTRFKWRHKETDRWRRLMDATCFQVDWMGQTRGPSFSQYGGHWTHILTCAHVICPWDYPNYYPPTGPTRFVSHVTLADTMTQVRLVSLQGTAVYKHFTSNQHVYVHSNPRLDLCVVHAEQNFKRSGEMKMLWMQNEGHVIRPRLEINDKLEVGDHVWVYGMSAHESLFDEEKGPEPLMIPTGVKARVHTVTREHFFIDTKSLEGDDKGQIHMGMCGSVIMRNGKCVGMLTATVHEESECTELAGTAMCTHSADIFEFLLEVEKQMKNPIPRQDIDETVFEERRRKEGQIVKEARDWALDHSRAARHIPVPSSLWHMEETWMTEEDFMTGQVFGRSGVFSQETQESTLGYDMNSAKTNGDRPGDIGAFATGDPTGKPVAQGERKDHSPTGVYADHEDFKTKDVWDYEVNAEMRSLFDKSVDDKDVHSLNMMRKSLENIRAQRAMDKMKESAMNHPSAGGGGGAGGGAGASAAERAMGGSGHFGGSKDGGASNFDPDNMDSDDYSGHHQQQQHQYSSSSGSAAAVGHPSSSSSSSYASPYRDADDDGTGTHNSSPYHKHRQQAPAAPAAAPETATERKRRERRETEAKYQEDLRKRHGRKAVPFGDEDLTGMWERERGE